MSRSRKKVAYYCDGISCRKYMKRLASKAVRKHGEFAVNGRCYRKIYDSWNIYDYRSTAFGKNKLEKWKELEPEYKIYGK